MARDLKKACYNSWIWSSKLLYYIQGNGKILMGCKQTSPSVHSFMEMAECFIQNREALSAEEREAILNMVHEVKRSLREEETQATAGFERGSGVDEHAAIVESIADGLLTIDRDWQITYINPTAAQNGRFQAQNLVGRNLWETFPALSGTPLETHYRTAMEERRSVQFEMKGVFRDQWYFICVYPAQNGITVLWLDNTLRIQDETERAQILAENRRQKALLDAIFAADPSGLAVAIGPDLRFVYVNPAYRFISPEPFDDPLGRRYEEVWPTESGEWYPDEIHRVLETGRPFLRTNVERRFTDEITRSFTFQARRIEWDDQPAALLILWDITDQKITEKALLESTRREKERAAQLQAIMDAVPAIVCVSHDPESLFVDGNSASYEFLRLPPGTNQSMAVQNGLAANPRIYQDGIELKLEELPLQISSATGQTFLGIEEEIVFPDGLRRTLLGNIVPLFDESGKPGGAVSAFIDITGRKQTEWELEAIIEHMETAVMVLDPELRLQRVNSAAARLHGFHDQAEMATQVHSLPELFETLDSQGNPIPAENWPMIRAARGETVSHQKLWVRRRDTGKKWVGLYSASPVIHQNGKVALILTTITVLNGQGGSIAEQA